MGTMQVKLFKDPQIQNNLELKIYLACFLKSQQVLYHSTLLFNATVLVANFVLSSFVYGRCFNKCILAFSMTKRIFFVDIFFIVKMWISFSLWRCGYLFHYEDVDIFLSDHLVDTDCLPNFCCEKLKRTWLRNSYNFCNFF